MTNPYTYTKKVYIPAHNRSVEDERNAIERKIRVESHNPSVISDVVYANGDTYTEYEFGYIDVSEITSVPNGEQILMRSWEPGE